MKRSGACSTTAYNDIGEQLAASERRLAAQSNALTELTERHADSTGRFFSRLQTILVTSARTLQVERLSLFVFECVKAHVATSPKYPKTVHYRGDGVFMFSGENKSYRRRFKPEML